MALCTTSIQKLMATAASVRVRGLDQHDGVGEAEGGGQRNQLPDVDLARAGAHDHRHAHEPQHHREPLPPAHPPGSDKGQRRLAQCLCKTGSQPLRAEAADGGQVGHAPGSMEIGIDVFTQRLQVKPTPGSDRRSAEQGFHHRVDTQFTLSPTWGQCEPAQSLRRRTGQVIENQNPCRSLRAVGMAGAGWNHQT
jgi:hypothetical protein